LVGPAVLSALRELSNEPTVQKRETVSDQRYLSLGEDQVHEVVPPPIEQDHSSGHNNGAFVDFDLSPQLSVPRLEEMSSVLVDELEKDLERYISEIKNVIGDIRRVASLGELPISIEKDGHTLRVHFPNSDGPKVERLLSDVDVSRGVVVDLESQQDCDTPVISPTSSEMDAADVWGIYGSDSFEDLDHTPGLTSESSLSLTESEVLLV
jgi:hypothetical protein